MDRHEKVKIIMNIAKENNLNQTTILFLLAVTTDKGLTKLVAEFQEQFPEIPRESKEIIANLNMMDFDGTFQDPIKMREIEGNLTVVQKIGEKFGIKKK